jgi:chromosome segregation ATPase
MNDVTTWTSVAGVLSLLGGYLVMLARLTERGMGSLTSEMRQGFAQIDSRFAQVDSRFAQVDSRFAQVDSRFDRLEARFDRLELRVDGLDRDITTLTRRQLGDP